MADASEVEASARQVARRWVEASARQAAPADDEGLPSVDLRNVHAGSGTMQQLKGFDKNGDNKIIDMADEIGKQEREKRAMKVPERFLLRLPTQPRRAAAHCLPSYSGDYRYAREDKDVHDVQLLLFESFGGFGRGVREILRKAADVLQNNLTRAQYLDEVTWRPLRTGWGCRSSASRSFFTRQSQSRL